MTASTELMINPEITQSELNKMNRQLTKQFTKLSELSERLFQKSFREASEKGVKQGLKIAGKGLALGGRAVGGKIGSLGKFAAGSLIGAGIDLFRGAEETSEQVDTIVERIRMIERQAGAVGVKSGELERLRLILTSAGIEEGEVQPTITAFARMLADARTGKDATLSQFTKYGTLEEAMQHFFSTVGMQDPKTRIATLSTVFDETAAQNIGSLIGADFNKLLSSAGIKADPDRLQQILDKAARATSEKSKQEARQELADLMQAGQITPDTIRTQEKMMNEQRAIITQAIQSFDVAASANIEIKKAIAGIRQLAIEHLPVIRDTIEQAGESLLGLQKWANDFGGELNAKITAGIGELKEQIKQIKLF